MKSNINLMVMSYFLWHMLQGLFLGKCPHVHDEHLRTLYNGHKI